MFRLLLFQFLKKLIHRIPKFFVILTGFAGVDELQQRGKVLFFLRGFIPDIANQCAVEQAFSLDPEILAGLLAIPLCIGDDGIDQFQNILLTADVMERIVPHGFFEVDGVQYFDFIPGIREHLSALDNNCAFGIGQDIADLFGHLHQVGLDVKSGFATAAAADHNDIFVPSILRMLWSTTHHQPFGLCEDDVVLEYRVDKRFDVLLVAPPGRAIFLALPILLCVLPFEVDHCFQCSCADQPHHQVERVKTGQDTFVGQAKVHKKNHQPVHYGIAIAMTVKPRGLFHHVKGDDVGEIQQDQLFHICCLRHPAYLCSQFFAPCRPARLVGRCFARQTGRFFQILHRIGSCSLFFSFLS